MKITDVPPDSDPSLNNSDDANSQQLSEQDTSSSFAKMLARKRTEDKEGNQPQDDAKRQADTKTAPVDLMLPPSTFQNSIQPTAVESKHIVALPPDLQQLVREVSVAVNSAGNHQVNIEMNSNVLKGLQIRIERGESGVAIQFKSTSDQVSALLSNNVASLSQGLADRGVRVSNISISGGRAASRSQDARNSYPGQAGRQRGR